MKDELQTIDSSDSKKVVITASLPDMTKVSFSEGDGALDIAWTEDDYLTVICGNVKERYDIVSFQGNQATFSGNPIDGDAYDIYLSCSDAEISDRSYPVQNQKTVTSVDHLKYDVVLSGVSDYRNVRFTSDWAEVHGGELIQNGCLLLHFQLPDDVGHIRRITLKASSPLFYKTNSVSGGMTDTMVLTMDDADMQADNVVKAHIMTSMQESVIPADAEFTLTISSDLGTWSRKFTPGASRIYPGRRNVIKLNSKNWNVPAGVGTKEEPYLIRTANELKSMAEKLGSEIRYVAMVNDIDASSITKWPSITHTKPIDFNGNDRTIYNFKPAEFSSDYAGFIGVLKGRIANLNFIGADVTGKDGKACGILCGYIGKANADSFGELENVHVEGKITGKAAGVGGLVGIIGSGKIKRCSADVEVHNDNTVSTYRTGGIAGYFNDGNTTNVCEISDCWTSGTIVGGMQKTGGIIGELYGNSGDYTNENTAIIENCYSTASVSGMRNVSGILAYVASKESTVVRNCIAWNDCIVATDTNHGHYSSGAVVGKTYVYHTLHDCYRRYNIDFSCVFQDLSGVSAQVCDQKNADADNKLRVGTYGEEDSIYKVNNCSNWYPYHGLSASSGSTLSEVARSLGWDESVWDFSHDIPALIR